MARSLADARELADLRAQVTNLQREVSARPNPFAWSRDNITPMELDEVLPQFAVGDVRQRHVHLAARTILCGAGGLMPTTTAGATDTGKVELSAQHDYYLLDFPDGAAKVYATVLIDKMPDNYDGRTLLARFHWIVNEVSTNPVIWGCQLLGLADGTALTAVLGTAQEISDAGSGTANQYRTSGTTPAITPGGTAAGGNGMLIVIYRDPANAGDTLAATARLLGISLEYTTSAFSD